MSNQKKSALTSIPLIVGLVALVLFLIIGIAVLG